MQAEKLAERGDDSEAEDEEDIEEEEEEDDIEAILAEEFEVGIQSSLLHKCKFQFLFSKQICSFHGF